MEEINLEFMSFSEAMQNFLEGKKITRKEYNESYIEITPQGEMRVYYSADKMEEVYPDFHVNMDDILAVDWYVVE